MRLSVGFFAGFCCWGGCGGAVAAAVEGFDSTGGGGAVAGVTEVEAGVPDDRFGLCVGLGGRRLGSLRGSRLRCTLLASIAHRSLTLARTLHLRSLLSRRTDRHGRVVGRECAWGRRSAESLARRGRSIGRRHAVTRRRRSEATHSTVARNSAWAAWESMRSTGSLEACLLLELGRRWALRETVRRRVGWLLLLLARRASELRRLLVRSLLLGRARRLRGELVKVLCTHNSPMSTLSTLASLISVYV